MRQPTPPWDMPFTSESGGANFRRAAGVAICAALLSTAPARATPLDNPWQAASTFLVRDAFRLFERGEGGGPLDREFGLAITLLNVQPRTQGNLRRALELFESVANRAETDSALQNLALFFRARVLEFYLEGGDREAAAAQYLELLKRKTANPVIELGAARLVIMNALGPGTQEDILGKLRELEDLSQWLQTPIGRREFHATKAYAILDNHGDKSRAVDHFLEADAVGFTRKINSLRLWVTAGHIAAEAGRTQEAVLFYSKLLEAFPRDPRAFMVRELLKALKNTSG